MSYTPYRNYFPRGCNFLLDLFALYIKFKYIRPYLKRWSNTNRCVDIAHGETFTNE